MSEIRRTGLTYADLEAIPDDGNRYEIIDGELFVTPPPDLAHGWAGDTIVHLLRLYMRDHGGRGQSAPTGVFFDQGSHVEPDVLYTRQEHLHRFAADIRYVQGPPDLVVEVSSPSTRRTDLIRKRALYERHGVEEYWFVDRDHELVLVHQLVDGAYGDPFEVPRGQVVHATAAPGFAVPVDDLFDAPGTS